MVDIIKKITVIDSYFCAHCGVNYDIKKVRLKGESMNYHNDQNEEHYTTKKSQRTIYLCGECTQKLEKEIYELSKSNT